jgi:hypothetical protein
MRLVAIGVGGSGAASVEVLTHLAALGLLPEGCDLVPIIVDQDQLHPRIRGTSEFIERYFRLRAGRQETRLTGGGLFATAMSRVVRTNVLQPSVHENLFDLLGLADAPTSKAAARLLFGTTPGGQSELGEPGGHEYASGYYGRVNAGVCFFNDAAGGAALLNALREHLRTSGVCVLFGSAFGGTGAAGLIHIARLIHDDQQLRDVPIAIVQLEPYFRPDDAGDAQPTGFVNSPRTFDSRTGAAYDYLANLTLANNVPCHALYLLGTPTPAAFPLDWFRRDQQDNPRLFLEYLAAMAARDFVINSPALVSPFEDSKGEASDKLRAVPWRGHVRVRRLPNQRYDGPLRVLRDLLHRAAVSWQLLDSYFIPLLEQAGDSPTLPGHPWVYDVCAQGGLTPDQVRGHFGQARELFGAVLQAAGAFPHDHTLNADTPAEARSREERAIRITRESFPPGLLPRLEVLSAAALVRSGDPMTIFDDYTLQGDAQLVSRALWRWIDGAIVIEEGAGAPRTGSHQLRWQEEARNTAEQPLQLPPVPNDEFHSAPFAHRVLTSLATAKWNDPGHVRTHAEYPSVWAPAIVHRDRLHAVAPDDPLRYVHLGLLVSALVERPGDGNVPVRKLPTRALNETFRRALANTCPLPAYDDSVATENDENERGAAPLQNQVLLLLFAGSNAVRQDDVPHEGDVLGFFYPDTVVVPAVGMSAEQRRDLEQLGRWAARRGFPAVLRSRLEGGWVAALEQSKVPNAATVGERFFRYLGSFKDDRRQREQRHDPERRRRSGAVTRFYPEFPYPRVAPWITKLYQ